MRYYKELDGVRAAAALMIMFCHFFLYANSENDIFLIIKKVSVFGQTGVSLFFVLSGFLISRILLHTKQEAHYFRIFYLRRILRIFPLYYFFLFLYYFIFPTILSEPIYSFDEQKYFWTYFQNVARTFEWKSEGPVHFWSLAVEEHFYFFWPVMFFFFSTKRLTQIIIGIVFFAFLIRLIMLKYHLSVYYFTLTRMDELAIGAFLAILEKKEKLTEENAKYFQIIFLSILIPLAVVWFFYTGEGNVTIQAIKYLLQSIVFFCFIGWVISAKSNILFRKILSLKVLSFTGMISYGLYVFHPLCFQLVNRFILTQYSAVNFLISFIVTFLIAVLSYYLLELPFLRLKRKLV